jgi:hypothetical protein
MTSDLTNDCPVKPWRILYHNFEEAIEQVKQWGEPFQLAYTVTIPDDQNEYTAITK